MKIRLSLLIDFIVIYLVLLSVPCHLSYAELTNKLLPKREGYKIGVGNSLLHSAFNTEVEFDSNIFLDDSGTKSDLITVLNPSVGLEIPFEDNSLSADYDVGINFFSRYSEQDHIDHRVRGLVEINWADYKITTGDTYRRFTDRAGSENTARVKRQTNELKTGLSAQFELLGFDVGYVNKIEDYLSNQIVYSTLTYEDKSTMTHVIRGETSYRFLPKTLLLLESDLGFIRYYNSSLSPDSVYTETVLGIKGEWFAKIFINFKAGLRYHNYDDSDIISSKDFVGPVARGGFDFNITEDDILTFGLERNIYESTYSNMNYYNVNMGKLEYTHNFNDKLSFNSFGSYQLNLYPSESMENNVTAKRHDNIFGGGCALRYDIRKWLSLEAKYEYKQRISKFDVFDYRDNIITLRGTAGF